MKSKQIHFDDNKYRSELGILESRLQKINKVWAIAKKCNVTEGLNENEITELFLDPAGLVSRKVTQKLNNSKEFSLLGIRFKSKSVFNVVEEPEALEELVAAHKQLILHNNLGIFRDGLLPTIGTVKSLLFGTFELKNGEFILPEKAKEELKKFCTVTLTNDLQIELHNRFESIAKDMQKVKELMGDKFNPHQDVFEIFLGYSKLEGKYVIKNEHFDKILN